MIKYLHYSELSKIINSNNIQIILFTAKWCDSCKMMYPVLNKLDEEKLSKVDIYIVDIDEESSIVNYFNIYSIPTLLMIYNQKIYRKESGYRSLELIKSYIDMIIKE